MEVRDLASVRVVALLPVGAVEAHGPHLPLETDGVIAGAMAEAAAERLADAGWQPLLLPPLPYAAAPFAAAFPGTVSVRGETVTALIVEIGRSLAASGVSALGIANAHLDPAHLASLHAAVETLRSRLSAPPPSGGRARSAATSPFAVAFPDLTRKPWALRLGAEFVSGACHAGRYESSVVMASRPELVREELRRRLPPNPASLSRAIREGKASFEEAGGPEAYFGWPAEASAEEGRRTIAVLGEILAEAVLAEAGD